MMITLFSSLSNKQMKHQQLTWRHQKYLQFALQVQLGRLLLSQEIIQVNLMANLLVASTERL